MIFVSHLPGTWRRDSIFPFTYYSHYVIYSFHLFKPLIDLLFLIHFFCSYPDTWYNDITSGARFYSMAATIRNKIVGMIVSEVKPRTRCNKEVWLFLLVPKKNIFMRLMFSINSFRFVKTVCFAPYIQIHAVPLLLIHS